MSDPAAFRARLLRTFQAEASRHVATLRSACQTVGDADAATQHSVITSAFRAAHSLAGASRAIDHTGSMAISAKVERELRELSDGERSLSPAHIASICADIDALDAVIRSMNAAEGRDHG